MKPTSTTTMGSDARADVAERAASRGTRAALVAALATLGCGHAAPRPTREVAVAEHARRERLPDDRRTLDGTWDDVHVEVAYAEGRARATLVLRHPKLRYFYQPEEPGKRPADKPVVRAAATGNDAARAVPDALRRMSPFDIDRIEIQDGELVFVDMSKPAKPELWLSQLEVSIENVASRAGMADGRPVLLTARAKVQRSGELALFVSADPWSEELNFSGRASVEGLATRELYSFLADTAKLQVPKGTLDLYLAFTAKDGKITGGVKPVLANAEVAPVRGGAMARLKAWVAGALLSLNSDRVQGRNAVVTVVPIEGDLTGPGVKLWPAIAGVLYNAYVHGVSAGFGGVPAGPTPAPAAAPLAATATPRSTGDRLATGSGSPREDGMRPARAPAAAPTAGGNGGGGLVRARGVSP